MSLFGNTKPAPKTRADFENAAQCAWIMQCRAFNLRRPNKEGRAWERHARELEQVALEIERGLSPTTGELESQ